jgi:hypothetical protein
MLLRDVGLQKVEIRGLWARSGSPLTAHRIDGALCGGSKLTDKQHLEAMLTALDASPRALERRSVRKGQAPRARAREALPGSGCYEHKFMGCGTSVMTVEIESQSVTISWEPTERSAGDDRALLIRPCPLCPLSLFDSERDAGDIRDGV